MKNIKKYFEKYKKIFSSIKFRKNIKNEKIKIFVQKSSKPKYKSKRNKFKLFISKLEFENTFNEIKNINTYYYIIWGFLILSSAYVLLFSHYFSVKNIDIIRQDDIINMDLSYKSIENIRYKPILFVNKESIKKSLITHQPNIKEIYIRKILPDNINIILTSYLSNFIFENNKKLYEITDNWVVIPSKQKENLVKLDVKSLSNMWILDYKKIFNQTHILKIKKIIELLKEKNSFLKIENLVFYKKEAELHIIDQNWIIIIFDLNKDELVQIEKLNIFHKQYFNKIKYWLIYLDLRVNEKIIYCARDNEFQCKQNLKNIYE